LSDHSLQTSLAYGAKVGHYFDRLPWLGMELEVFNAHPHIKQQDVTITAPPPGGSITFLSPGATIRMTTLAFNVLARYPGKHFQPYAGVGLGVFFARLHDKAVGASQSSTTEGLNTQLGLRYLVTDRVFAFGEWKFNYVRTNFNQTPALFGFDATYTARNFMFGVGYNF
jgi:opacity protein-like surface antigen